LEGILWHQGENDSTPERAIRYGEKFALIVKTFRSELNAPNLPIVIGGLGNYLMEGMYGDYFSAYQIVNKSLQEFAKTNSDCYFVTASGLKFAKTNSDCYFVTASGLTPNPDFIHIDAASQRIFGIRYFEAFNKHEHIMEPLTNENKILAMINERPLSKTEKTGLLDLKFSIGALSLKDYKTEQERLKQ